MDRLRKSAESRKRPSWSQLLRKYGSSVEAWHALHQVPPEEKERQAAEVKVRARSWLLTKGWERKGKLGVTETPAVDKAVQRRVTRACRAAGASSERARTKRQTPRRP